MSVCVQWVNAEKTVIRHTYRQSISADDTYIAINENKRLLESVSHPVIVIADFTGVQLGDLPLSSVLRHADFSSPQNQYGIIAVGANAFITAMLRVSKAVAPVTMKTLRYADSYEQAVLIVDEMQNEIAQSAS